MSNINKAIGNIQKQYKLAVDYSEGKDLTAISLLGEQAEVVILALGKQVGKKVDYMDSRINARSLKYKIPDTIPNPPKAKIDIKQEDQDREIIQERISVLVQALKLILRHFDNRSGLEDEEIKNYIKIVLKIY